MAGEEGGEQFVCGCREVLPKYLGNANLSGSKIYAFSLLNEVEVFENTDLTNTQLHVGGNLLLGIEKSRKLMIKILVERGVTTARGLGDEYQAALIDAELIAPPKKSESELAPSLAAAGFTIASIIKISPFHVRDDTW